MKRFVMILTLLAMCSCIELPFQKLRLDPLVLIDILVNRQETDSLALDSFVECENEAFNKNSRGKKLCHQEVDIEMMIVEDDAITIFIEDLSDFDIAHFQRRLDVVGFDRKELPQFLVDFSQAGVTEKFYFEKDQLELYDIRIDSDSINKAIIILGLK